MEHSQMDWKKIVKEAYEKRKHTPSRKNEEEKRRLSFLIPDPYSGTLTNKELEALSKNIQQIKNR